MEFTDHPEWMGALLYPLMLLLSAVWPQSTPIPSRAPATITELKEQIIANTRLLHLLHRQETSLKNGSSYKGSSNKPYFVIISTASELPAKGKKSKSPVLGTTAMVVNLNHPAYSEGGSGDGDGTTASYVGSPKEDLGAALENLLEFVGGRLADQMEGERDPTWKPWEEEEGSGNEDGEKKGDVVVEEMVDEVLDRRGRKRS